MFPQVLPALVIASCLGCTLAAQPNVLVIEDGQAMAPVGMHLGIRLDPIGAEISDLLLPSTFSPSSDPVPNMGLVDHPVWLSLHLKNNTGHATLVAYMPHPELERIDVFLLKPDGSVTVRTLGQSLPRSTDPMSDLDPVAALDILPGSSARVLIRLQSEKQLQIPLYIGPPPTYTAQLTWRNAVLGAYMGVLLVLLLYNLFVFISTRDRGYGLYVVYIAFVALTQATFLGIGKYILWPDMLWWSVHSSMILTVLTAVAANEFMYAFLQVKEKLPKLFKLRSVFYAIIGASLLLRITYWPLEGYNLLQMSVGPLALYQLLVSAILVARGERTGRYFLLAWTIFLIGIVVFILKDFNVLPYNGWTKYTMPLGSAVEGILLSFGLADKINILRREKERSQADALAALKENERIIRDQNAILEQKVTERTHELVEANNELKRTQVQLVEAEKMAGLGQLTAGIAHEINNPINFINSNIPPLRRNLQDMTEVIRGYRSGHDDPAARLAEADKLYNELGIDDALAELDGMIGSIDEGARRTAEIVKGLRNFSRLDEDALKLADLNEGVRSTLALLSPQVRGQVTFSTVLAELPQAECLPGKLNQAIMNLLTNAAQSVRAKHGETGQGLVSIRTWHEDGRITIAVKDNGVGLTDEVKSRMFEPFFTTKGVGEGTGLGLSITYSIVQKHNGQIAVDSTPGHGAEFRITVPVQQEKNDNMAQRA